MQRHSPSCVTRPPASSPSSARGARAGSSSGYVFTKESGEPLHPERISALFNRLVRDACLPRIPLHGLRHTYASLALAKGVNPLIVSRRLGHSTVAFTLDVYSHVLPQVDAEAAELIAAVAGSDSRE